MRINKAKLQKLMTASAITLEDMATVTGLTSESLTWIMDGGEVSTDALERIASAVGAGVKDIALPDSYALDESTIDFMKDSDRATLTLTQGRLKTRVEKLAKSHPDECQIVVHNRDGSVLAHCPVDWIKIIPPRQYTDEERAKRAEQLRQNLENHR